MAVKRNHYRAEKKLLKRKLRQLIIFLLVAAAVIYFFQTAEDTVKPALNSTAEIKIKTIIKDLVLESVDDVTSSADGGASDIIFTSQDSDGKVSLVTLNTNLLNQIGTEISENVNKGVSEGKEHIMTINLGTILGSRILSQILPNIQFKVVPLGVSNVNYSTEFESAGINQTKYKVYINIDTEARLKVPFMTERIETQNTVLIAEAVIVGDVPDTYANIAEEQVSDYVN